MLMGCAIHYYDKDTGREHIWGVGHIARLEGTETPQLTTARNCLLWRASDLATAIPSRAQSAQPLYPETQLKPRLPL